MSACIGIFIVVLTVSVATDAFSGGRLHFCDLPVRVGRSALMMSVLPTLLQPAPTAEELALKEQVTQVLTSQGVLAKLKAELRAAVFEVMHEREGFAKTNDPTAPNLSDFPWRPGQLRWL